MPRPRIRLAAALATLASLAYGLGGPPALAAIPPPSPPAPPVPTPVPTAQERELAARAALVDNALAASAADLAAVTSDLGRLEPRVAALQAQIDHDQQRLKGLSVDLRTDQTTLERWMRQRFEQGDGADLLGYVVAGDGFRAMFARRQVLNDFIKKGRELETEVRAKHEEAAHIAAGSIGRLSELEIDKHKRETLTVLRATKAERLALAAATATTAPATDAAVTHLLAEYHAQQAELEAAKRAHTVYGAAGGGAFTVNTDLTQPSGETAEGLDAFLSGTALRGLGSAYVAAEQDHHVSARYLLAHSIEESSWGRSILARDKHNLFGFGADDAHPYEHAASFPDDAACIDAVAGAVAKRYLQPTGAEYAGPTLRGMNVHYASDPFWARKIARIANTIP